MIDDGERESPRARRLAAPLRPPYKVAKSFFPTFTVSASHHSDLATQTSVDDLRHLD